MDQPSSVAEAVKTGDRLASLTCLRDTIARAIDDCESKRDLAALSVRLTDVLAQIAELAPSEELDAVDEIAARRDLRRSSAPTGASRSKRPG